ncbi:MAG TPA: GNAT family N-acetyltransferase [Devosiaceae bacterium]|nr:GNAT family N-acetyltransferase [Devosiaceae bacterium]
MSVTLTTRRLILRPPSMDDAEAIVRYLNNFAVAGNLATVPYPYRLADAEFWLGRQRDNIPPEETGFAIELPGAGYVGNIGFHLTARQPELGYWLGEPFWHRGIMTEAAQAAVDWYFGVGRESVIRSGVFYFNKASLAVQKKLGFTETGSSYRHCLARGEEVRHIDTQLSRADWAGAKQ